MLTNLQALPYTKMTVIHLDHLIKLALEEDLPDTDVTQSCLNLSVKNIEATLIAKSPGIFYGVNVINACCHTLSPPLTSQINCIDGQEVASGEVIAQFFGPSTTLLKIERTMLNFLQRLSGIATVTNQFVLALNNNHIQLLDTRKTTPGLRILEKQAVVAGGGHNHRHSLSDMVLIKENHLRSFLLSHAQSDLGNMLEQWKHAHPDIPIEIEISSSKELQQYELSSADIIMLDNFSHHNISQASQFIRARYPKTKIEVSGNITLNTIQQYRNLDIDRISVGSLTHSVRALDLSLLF